MRIFTAYCSKLLSCSDRIYVWFNDTNIIYVFGIISDLNISFNMRAMYTCLFYFIEKKLVMLARLCVTLN
jgi:hypothetical protein